MVPCPAIMRTSVHCFICQFASQKLISELFSDSEFGGTLIGSVLCQGCIESQSFRRGPETVGRNDSKTLESRVMSATDRSEC